MSIVDEPTEFHSFRELDAWLDEQAAARRAERKPERTCPDCGRERPRFAHRCRQCAARSRRKKARQRQRRRRAGRTV